jgi:anti-sigma factor (TIGR02949 family)
MNDAMNESMSGPMLDCEAVMKQLWDYLDEELTPERMQAIKEHVQMCERCSPQVQFERAFLSVLGAARQVVANEESLRSRVVAQLRTMGYTA